MLIKTHKTSRLPPTSTLSLKRQHDSKRNIDNYDVIPLHGKRTLHNHPEPDSQRRRNNTHNHQPSPSTIPAPPPIPLLPQPSSTPSPLLSPSHAGASISIGVEGAEEESPRRGPSPRDSNTLTGPVSRHSRYSPIHREGVGRREGGRERRGGGEGVTRMGTRPQTPLPPTPTFFNGIHKHTHTVSWPRSRVPHKVTSFSTLIIQALTRCLA